MSFMGPDNNAFEAFAIEASKPYTEAMRAPAHGMTPQVDFLLPVYNAADTLDETLESLVRQTFGDFRVIVIDDGSSDASADILAQWQRRDSRFVVEHQANSGIVSALNRGLALVEAQFVARIDADDICFPERLAVQHAYLLAHEDCAAVGCRVSHIDGLGRAVAGLPQPGDPALADPCAVPAREPYLIHPFMMARTSALRQGGGYRPVPHSEDSDLFWRLSEHGRLHNLPATLGQYRLHGKSISGGSVIDGRVMAVGSRLGALSAALRRRGHADIDFSHNLRLRLQKAESLTAMSAIVEPLVPLSERPLFRLGAGIKLLELTGYRPYEIDFGDCHFIAGELAALPMLASANRKEVRWHLAATAARLLRKGRFREAAVLAPPSLFPRIVRHLVR